MDKAYEESEPYQLIHLISIHIDFEIKYSSVKLFGFNISLMTVFSPLSAVEYKSSDLEE